MKTDKGKMMTKDEFLLAAKQFALANNPVSVGDIVSNGSEKILVEKIMVYSGCGLPFCVYQGPLLKKNGDKYKSGKRGDLYQQSIVSHIKGGD